MTTSLSPHWQQFYMRLAREVATGSKDASSKFGAILVRPDKTVASIGFNGFPRRVADDVAMLTDPAKRAQKYARIVHAECNCLNHSRDVSTAGYFLVVSGHPCDRCALRIASTDIAAVYYCSSPDYESRWAAEVEVSRQILSEAGIALIRVD